MASRGGKQTRWGAEPGLVVTDRERCVLTCVFWRIGVGLGERRLLWTENEGRDR